jgi:hypothetical protein
MLKRNLMVWALAALICLPTVVKCQKKGSTGSKSGGGDSSSQPSNGGSKSDGSSGGGKSDSGGKADGGGFSIEAEIIAYKSLQSDSEAIACDIAVYLAVVQGSTVPGSSFTPSGQQGHKVDFDWQPLSEICKGISMPNKAGKVLITSSADTTLANIQQWRLNMTILQGLFDQSIRLASENSPCDMEKHKKELEEISKEHLSLINLTPDLEFAIASAFLDEAPKAISLVKDVLGLFASNESVSGVAGTIQDQALVDGVSRQLRALRVEVLVPGLFSSYTLGGKGNSPFLSYYALLLDKQTALTVLLEQAKKCDALMTDSISKIDRENKPGEADKRKAEKDKGTLTQISREAKALIAKIQTVLAGIDAFNGRLTGTANKTTNSQPDASTTKLTDTSPKPSATTQAEPSPLATILSADGLMLKLTGGCEEDQLKNAFCTSGEPPADSCKQNELTKLKKTLCHDDEPLYDVCVTGTAQTARTDFPGLTRSLYSCKNQALESALCEGKGDQNKIKPNLCQAGNLRANLCGGTEQPKVCTINIDKIRDWRMLSLKALESGGSILTGGNLFTGTRVHYSGGAVATYALFKLDGDLDCSGNVYDYGGYISPKNFRKEFRKPNINPDQQLIFFRGRCAVE